MIIDLHNNPFVGEFRFKLDYTFLILCIILLTTGFIIISSASTEVAYLQFKDPLHYSKVHAIYLLIGFIAMLLVLMIPMSWYSNNRWILLALTFAMLFLVFIPGIGNKVNGASRWLKISVFTLQPSEFAKIAVVIFISTYLVRQQKDIRSSWSGFFRPFMVLLPFSWLLLAEPDFGATVVMMSVAIGMLFLGGVNLGRFSLMLVFAIASLSLVLLLEDYRVKRFTSFTDPWSDQFGSGYQLTQSLIAFGRGSYWGMGLGNSIQKQFYLPEAHTDFVFAILAEEFGLAGSILVSIVFFIVIAKIFFIGYKASSIKQLFSAYSAYGISLLFAGQFLINTYVNTGLLPTKGLTLPLLSYGGSSLLACFIQIGICLRIDWERIVAENTVKSTEDTEYIEFDENFLKDLKIN